MGGYKGMSKKYKIIGALVLMLAVFLTGCTSKEEKASLESFAEASTKVVSLNNELDQSISEAEVLISTNEKCFDETAIGTLETAVSTAKASKLIIPEKPKELEAIKNETEKLNKVDYSDTLQQIAAAKKVYENGIKQLKQVTAPTEGFVIERIQAVEGITGVSAVTEDNDRNGNLGKQGGYTAQVFFTYNLVNQSDLSFEGDSIIEKGTDGGGSIEVYSTVEDAENRNTYLGAFDVGILASGSHRVVGTMIVRTSDELTASQQKKLELKLINSLIELK